MAYTLCMSSYTCNTVKTPAGGIVLLLQRRGPMTTRQMQKELGVTATAVRVQTERLVAEGMITKSRRHVGRGRPADEFRITDKIHTLYGRNYGDLLSLLFKEIRQTMGKEVVRKLLDGVCTQLVESYKDAVTGQTLDERLRQIAELLHSKGIPAEVIDDDGPPGLLMLGCPYHELSRDEPLLCEMETKMFSRLIGAPVKLYQCKSRGDPVCEIRVTDSARWSGRSIDSRDSVEDRRVTA